MSDTSFSDSGEGDVEDRFDSANEEAEEDAFGTGVGLSDGADRGLGIGAVGYGVTSSLDGKKAPATKTKAKPKWSMFSKVKGKKKEKATPPAKRPAPVRSAPSARSLTSSDDIKIDPGAFDVERAPSSVRGSHASAGPAPQPVQDRYLPADPGPNPVHDNYVAADPGPHPVHDNYVQGDPAQNPLRQANGPAVVDAYGAAPPKAQLDAELEISEDLPFVPSNRQEAMSAFEDRKRAGFRAAKPVTPVDADGKPMPHQTHTPRKIDTEHWGEHETYFRPAAHKAMSDHTGLPARTKYYNDKEREQHKVGVQDGLLTSANGKLLDTTKAEAPLAMTAQAGRHIFAMSEGDDLYSADAIAENNASTKRAMHFKDRAPKLGLARGAPDHLDYTHHSSFLEGKAVDEFGVYDSNKSQGVKGAGELAVKEGWLQKISNVSGHYLPDIKNTAATLNALDAKGVNTDATKVENMVKGTDGSITTSEYMGRAVAATGGNIRLMDAHKKAFEKINSGNFGLRPTAAPAGPSDAWWKEEYQGMRPRGASVAELPVMDAESAPTRKERAKSL